MTNLKEMNVGDIVTNDFRTAQVFKEFGIDFCCGGNVKLESIAKEKNIDLETIENELINVESRSGGTVAMDYKNWNPDFLADYIVNQYHNKVYRNIPQISEYVNKIAQVHGGRHPELIRINDLFQLISQEMPIHQRQEEKVFFPAIKEAQQNGTTQAKNIILSQLKDMREEHDLIGRSMDEINVLSNAYELPADACKTYMVAFKMLEEFEDDLHVHVHLENNILFPKAEKLAV
jgi:regulator of cell morphogenesis and NO signaling